MPRIISAYPVPTIIDMEIAIMATTTTNPLAPRNGLSQAHPNTPCPRCGTEFYYYIKGSWHCATCWDKTHRKTMQATDELQD
jgi:hypothetical protein